MNKLQRFFKNKKVLITGHTGFKGSWLTQILLNWGANITGIALKPNTKPSLFQVLGLEKKIRNHFCDIRNFKKISEIINKEKPEIIFHLAAQALVRDSYDCPLYTFETNIIGTANVLEAIRQTKGVVAAVMITTDKVYEEKEKNSGYEEKDKLGGYDPYSGSKAGAEIVIDSYIKSFFNLENYRKHQTLIASARAGNVIGGGDWAKDRIIPDIIKTIFENNKKIIVRNPNSIRPWQFVLEPLYGYMLLAKNLYEGNREFSGAWNFGPGEENYLTVKELTEEAIRLLGKGSYVIKEDGKKHEANLLKLNSSKAKNILGWQPVFNLDRILELTFDWYRSFYNKECDINHLTNQQIELFFDEI